VKSLVEALKKLKVKCSMEGKTTPPVTVEGDTLKGGTTELPGNISSQFISALLLVAPLAEEEVSIRLTTELTSRPYLLMTLQCLRKFGINVRTEFDRFIVRRQRYKPAQFKVEGDWSSASYFLALGALAGRVEVKNLNPESPQGDRIMLDLLRSMGAEVETTDDSVIVHKSRLKAIRADLSDCIDLLPTMAVLAAAANGVSEFTGIARARMKESNRVAVVKEGLELMGIKVDEERDRLTITGSSPKGAMIYPRDDHRIAMAFSVLGSVAGNTVITNAECVSKTYPEFWDVLKSIGGEVEINEK
jgi:3-phosphoshikimate 1-carboxyvinyltransferase